ncbi:glutamate-1-semialdehyde 2,1-aminomutase [Prevotella sp. MA2016]|uniref:glutamate-1-semialdehyde 2,1-aminomutase n=1 Tax=Prevotella sp. MA2016 TaxID=1408310 RepID=UPI00048AA0C9|nr:glutamate-1-semialdehyde 2,1-aminomutase [Prevotella sp. MA2016]
MINERIKSAAAFEQALKVIPGGVNSPVRALKSVGTTPLFVKEAQGAYFTDIDDNRIIDFCMSWGVFILGHNNARVSQAAIDAVGRGSSYGIPTVSETTLAEKVRQAFPSMERLRFVNSGTEATMSAIRVARGFTGRNILVKFEGNYHGHADHLLVSAGSGVANISNASSAGVPDGFVKYTAVLPYNDTEALRQFFSEHGHEVAALIIEPVACNMGVVVPTEDFLKATREVTEQYGAILIFDEVITGFRLSLGGAQQRFGIKPDMTTVGKIVGGGFPAAAFGGREDIMKVLAPDGPVYQAGTLSGNPVAMAAGIETLTQLSRPGFYDELEAKSDAFIAKLEQIIAGKGIQLNRCGSMFTLFFNDSAVRNFKDTQRSDQQRFARYFRNMLSRGIYVSPSQFEGNFISETHTPEILDYVLQSIAESID